MKSNVGLTIENGEPKLSLEQDVKEAEWVME